MIEPAEYRVVAQAEPFDEQQVVEQDLPALAFGPLVGDLFAVGGGGLAAPCGVEPRLGASAA